MIVVKCTDLDRQALSRIEIDPAEMMDDGTNYTGIRIPKPWGHEIEKYRDDKVAIWWLHIHSGCETSMHCHPNKLTLLMVIGGRAVLSTLEGNYSLSEGTVVVIEPGAFHRTTADKGPVVLYETESPPNKRDLVRLIDSYGRGQGYERVQRPEKLSAAH